MGQTTEQIENHIASRREDLHSNLQELETKVKLATDWRHHFRKHPGLALAAAFGGGMLLSALVGKPRVKKTIPSSTASDISRSRASGIGREALNTWDGIKGALLGVVATRIKEMLGNAVPRFSEHLSKSEGDRGYSAPARGPEERNH